MKVTRIIHRKKRSLAGRLLCRVGDLMLVIGILCTGWYVMDFAEARGFQVYGKVRLAEALMMPRDFSVAFPSPKSRGDSIGQLDIPRLGISAIVMEGADAGTLKLGVGHIQGTALPGALGNVSLAAHRDTFFRPLRHIRKGDEIRLTTFDGSWNYRVDWTKIVEPTDVQVLKPDKQRRTLTLVTCYPFYMVGSAPDRFVVRARQVR